jgi:hypothetical protein
MWQQDRWADNGSHALLISASNDGGRTWHSTPLASDHCVRGGLKYDRADDPWVSIGPDGRGYASGFAITYPSVPGTAIYSSAVVASSSTDGGRTWPAPVIVQAENRKAGLYVDKDEITADPTRAGVAYLTWRQADLLNGRSPLWFARTVDGGKTWSRPMVIVAAHGRIQGGVDGQIVVNRRTDTLYAFLGYGRLRTSVPSSFTRYIADITSANGGATWSTPHLVSTVDVRDTNDDPVRWERLPAPAIDPRNGTLYVAWDDSRLSHGRYPEVLLSRSTDGVHWSAPTRANGLPPVLPQIVTANRALPEGRHVLIARLHFASINLHRLPVCSRRPCSLVGCWETRHWQRYLCR